MRGRGAFLSFFAGGRAWAIGSCYLACGWVLSDREPACLSGFVSPTGGADGGVGKVLVHRLKMGREGGDDRFLVGGYLSRKV